MELVDKKILVAGGAGFIGSHLVDVLAADNEVTVLDNLSSGRIENISHHIQSGSIQFIQADIQSLDQMMDLAAGNDVVFHFAVQGLRLSLLDPQLVHHVNATGTLNMCMAAFEACVERFVYISSSEVYGTAKTVPMNEDHPLEPTTPYGASKLAGEAYARSYYLTYNVPTVIVRPFNAYGPREHLEGVYGEVIPRFVLRVMNGLSPIIFGDGQQTRDFTEVGDIVRGIIGAAECDALVGETVNVAAGREVAINEVAQIVLELMGQDGSITPIHMEPRPGDVRRHYADITKARRMFNYQPQTGINRGIEQYIDWVRIQNWDLEQLQQKEVILNWRP